MKKLIYIITVIIASLSCCTASCAVGNATGSIKTTKLFKTLRKPSINSIVGDSTSYGKFDGVYPSDWLKDAVIPDTALVGNAGFQDLHCKNRKGTAICFICKGEPDDIVNKVFINKDKYKYETDKGPINLGDIRSMITFNVIFSTLSDSNDNIIYAIHVYSGEEIYDGYSAVVLHYYNYTK